LLDLSSCNGGNISDDITNFVTSEAYKVAKKFIDDNSFQGIITAVVNALMALKVCLIDEGISFCLILKELENAD
jgi:hypothetical protein